MTSPRNGSPTRALVMRQAGLDTDPRQALRAIGRAAQEASTPAEDAYLGLFGTLDGTAWPAGFRCTATDTETGDAERQAAAIQAAWNL